MNMKKLAAVPQTSEIRVMQRLDLPSDSHQSKLNIPGLTRDHEENSEHLLKNLNKMIL